VLSHELNDVLRILTVLSVVFLPLTLIASIFGMNVRVPGEHSIVAFWEIMVAMIVILVGMIAFFKRRDWL
jgi:magnesium transporter